MRHREKVVEKQIDNLVGALTDPIIVWPGGWADSLPGNLKADITVHRLAQLMKGEEDLATWPEVCAYLFTVTLEHPVGREWANIYMYAMTQYKGDAMPEDIRCGHLDDDEMAMLTEFRRWLWNARVKARRDRGRQERAREKAEAAARAPKQFKLPV